MFDATETGGYAKVFGSRGLVWEGVTEEDFRLLAGEWFFCSDAREAFAPIKEAALEREDLKTKPLVKAALERRWVLYYTLGELARERCRRADRDVESDFRQLYKPKWLDESQEHGTRRTVRQYCDAAREVMVRVYKTAAKSPDFVQRNWYRSRDMLADIREYIHDAGALVESLSTLARHES